MTITEARKFIVNMVNEHKALNTLSEALALLENGEQVIEGLNKRKTAAEEALLDAHAKLASVSKVVNAEMEELDVSLADKKAAANNEISVLTTRINDLHNDLSEATTKIKTETSRLMAEQRVELSKLDSLIKDRTDTLNKMNQEIEKVKAKIMG